jgi:hypothetical protein
LSLYTKYYWDDKIKEDEIGRVCGAHGRHEFIAKHCSENMEERDYLEDLDVDGRIILK